MGYPLETLFWDSKWGSRPSPLNPFVFLIEGYIQNKNRGKFEGMLYNGLRGNTLAFCMYHNRHMSRGAWKSNRVTLINVLLNNDFSFIVFWIEEMIIYLWYKFLENQEMIRIFPPVHLQIHQSRLIFLLVTWKGLITVNKSRALI